MDSGISPDSGNQDSSVMEVSEICVPLDAVSIDGQAPSEGDSVTMDFRVTRIEGGDAYLAPEKVNGQEVDQEDQQDQGADENSEPQFDAQGQYMQ